MHRVAGQLVREVSLACDAETLFLRLRGAELARRLAALDLKVSVVTERPRSLRVQLDGNRGDGTRLRADRLVELAVPFAVLRVRAGEIVSLFVLITDAVGTMLEQHPEQHPIEFTVPPADVASVNWLV